VVPPARQARVPHAADTPSLREEGLARAEDHRALLDHLHPPRARLAGEPEAPLMLDVKGKRVVVVGLGASGIAACELLARRGARVVGTDSKTDIAPIDGVEMALGG